MDIRSENGRDQLAVRTVNTSAFETHEEADIVERLREKAKPVISLVAEKDDSLVGHIMFTPVSISGRPDLKIMGLAPMAVTPKFQGTGIGSALVRAGVEQCRQLGFSAVVVLGHPEYYPRFGFEPAVEFGIRCEYEVPEEAFMAVELEPGYLQGVPGVAKYHEAFGGV